MFQPKYGMYDGGKYVCMDDLVGGNKVGGSGDGRCLVYSFGIRNDISFEQTMLQYGETLSLSLSL